jgi:outer membrane protein TolC
MTKTAYWNLRLPALVVLSLLAASHGLLAQAEPSLPSTPPAPVVLTLPQARELALKNNKQLVLAHLNLEASEYAIKAARTDYFPKVLGTAVYLRFNEDLGTVLATRRRSVGGDLITLRGTGPANLGANIRLPTISIPSTTTPVSVVNQDTAVGMLMVAQPITKLIAVSAAVDLARADAGVAAAKLDQGTNAVLSGVTQVYCGLHAAQRIRDALALQAAALEPLVKAKPLPQLRLGLLEVRKGLVEAETQIADLTHQLLQLTGLPMCSRIETVDLALPPVQLACAEEAAQCALANNPQIREAEQNITKANAGLRVAKMNYLPDVNVFGAYTGQTAADYIPEGFGFAGVSASYTFWDWGKRKQERLQRMTQLALANQNVQVTIETVQEDARKTYLAYKQAEQELQIARETVQVQEEAEQGLQEPAAVLQAKAATAKAQLDLLQADLTYRLAQIKLLAVVGHP